MSIITSVRRCYNCGKVLQDKDPSREGYVEPTTLISLHASDMILCHDCYENILLPSPEVRP